MSIDPEKRRKREGKLIEDYHRLRIKDYHRRCEVIAGIGPTSILKYLRERNEREQNEGDDEMLFGGFWQLDILLHETASDDTALLPVEQYDPTKHNASTCIPLAQAILDLPGLRFSAAIGENALRAYIFHLVEHLGLGWCDERAEMADCLIDMFKRRGGEIACRWPWEGFCEWWTGAW